MTVDRRKRRHREDVVGFPSRPQLRSCWGGGGKKLLNLGVGVSGSSSGSSSTNHSRKSRDSGRVGDTL